jgi:hypothetical protein
MTLGLLKSNTELEKEKVKLVDEKTTLVKENEGLAKDKEQAQATAQKVRVKNKDLKRGVAELSMFIPPDKREEVQKKLTGKSFSIFNDSVAGRDQSVSQPSAAKEDNAYKTVFGMNLKSVTDKAKSLHALGDENAPALKEFL